MSNWLAGIFRRFVPAKTRSGRPGTPAIAATVDAELRDIFLNELTDIIGNVEKALAAWQADFANPAHTKAMVRAFHTLKGSAPIVGASTLAELGQAAEQAAKQAARKRNPDLTQIAALEAAVALLPQWNQAIRGNLPTPEGTPRAIAALRRTLG